MNIKQTGEWLDHLESQRKITPVQAMDYRYKLVRIAEYDELETSIALDSIRHEIKAKIISPTFTELYDNHRTARTQGGARQETRKTRATAPRSKKH